MVTNSSWPASATLRERALARIPGAVNSNIRITAPPLYFERGQGSRLWDVDGNDYVDYILGQGPNFLGHANTRINSAVARACTRGMVFGAQHAAEIDAAERVCAALGWADSVRFGLTGTEAVQAAIRLARAATGRRRFVRFEGHYHGWLDNVLVRTTEAGTGAASEGQLADYLDDCYVLAWNDEQALADLLDDHGDDIAAVIMEPVMINAGSIEPNPGYLERVRLLCTEHDIVLIFDEVISGFRLALGGAASRYGVTPDLATYGKAMAGGWPVAALAGREELMARLGTGQVNHSGTFNGSVMATAAVIATLDELTENPPYERVAEYGRTLMAELAKLGAAHGIPLSVQGVPMAFHLSFGGDQPVSDYRGLATLDLDRYARFATTLAHHGVWVAARGVWYISAAHSDEDLALTLERVNTALGEPDV